MLTDFQSPRLDSLVRTSLWFSVGIVQDRSGWWGCEGLAAEHGHLARFPRSDPAHHLLGAQDPVGYTRLQWRGHLGEHLERWGLEQAIRRPEKQTEVDATKC